MNQSLIMVAKIFRCRTTLPFASEVMLKRAWESRSATDAQWVGFDKTTN